MGFMEKMVKQCRKPTGRFGRFVGMGMNMGHGKLRRWGLSHISINKARPETGWYFIDSQ